MTAWPTVVWDAPALRGLDERTRGEIEAAGTLRTLASGEVLYRPGEPADDLFVVVEGSVELRVSAQPARRAERGDSFGEEASVRMTATRRVEAVAVSASRIARIPASVVRRGASRGGGSKVADRVERSFARDAAREILRGSALGGRLARSELDALLDATSHVHLARGDALYRVGDPATHVHVVADGLVQRLAGGQRHHFDRGGVVDLEERAERRRADVFAVGPSWVLAVRRDALRSAGATIVLSRALDEPEPTHDVYRAKEARSLVVIDQDACVRCGSCVAGCASSHADGLSRLIRRGEKVAVGGGAPSLLLAQSCHQCEHPACLASCPTAAIVRDASGDVTIREDLCTGCGACVKACPWDNVQMAPGNAGHPVAAKCDACGELDGGPACVRSCPTEAIARVAPEAVFSPVDGPVVARRSAWPALVGASCIAVALSLASLSHVASGALVGASMVAATAYAVAKRAPWKRGKRRAPSTAAASRVRAPFVAHIAIGIVAMGGVVAHGGLRLANGVAGALVVAFWIASASGVLAGVAYRLIPRRLSRLEREGVLAEEVAGRAKELRDREFTAISGKSAGTKAIYAKLIAPYANAPLGGLAMALPGRTLAEEELRLRGRIRAVVGERSSEEQTRDLVTLAVDQRAVCAQRWLGASLRMWVPVHVVAVAVAIALLALHIAYVLRR